MWTTRPGSLNGRPRKNRSLIRLKIAVFNPIPSASVSNASKVNPGDLSNCRRAKRRSVIKLDRSVMDFETASLVSQCDHWIDLRSTARWNETRRRRDESEHSCNREINEWIERVDLEENVLQSSSGENSEKQCGATGAKDKPDAQLPGALRHDHAEDAGRIQI